jgi:predicted AAA+ superfamily ATPase
MLLYGDAGTGKSSTIKAVVNEYAQKGLRLVEIRKTQIFDIPQITKSFQGTS